MLIYVGKNFTSSVKGAVVKRVSCERCQQEYFYQLARTAVGHGTAPYYIAQAAAARRAEKSAKKSLEKRLRTENESVPCPACGWIQYDMVQSLRKGRHRWLLQIALVVGSVALFFELLIALIMYLDGHASRETWIQLAEWMILTLGGAGALLSLRSMLLSRIDPNSAFPQPPAIPAGTPPALLREVTDGVERFVPANVERATQTSDWAEVQLQRCVLPTICCVCTEQPGHAVFKTPMSSGSEIPAPVCSDCQRSITRRWWMWAFLSLLLGLGIAAGISIAAPKPFDKDRWTLFIVLGIAGAIICVASIPRWKVKPFRMKMIDASRGVARLWFVNSEYTRQLMQQYESAPPVEFHSTAVTMEYHSNREGSDVVSQDSQAR